MTIVPITQFKAYIPFPAPQEVRITAPANRDVTVIPPVTYTIEGKSTAVLRAGGTVTLKLTQKNYVVSAGNFTFPSIDASQITGTKTSAFISDFGDAVYNAVLTGLTVVTATPIANGDSLRTALAKLQAQIAAATGAVSSVFGRTGAVTAQSGDYDALQVDYDNSTSGLTATNVQDAIDELNTDIQAINPVGSKLYINYNYS